MKTQLEQSNFGFKLFQSRRSGGWLRVSLLALLLSVSLQTTKTLAEVRTESEIAPIIPEMTGQGFLNPSAFRHQIEHFAKQCPSLECSQYRLRLNSRPVAMLAIEQPKIFSFLWHLGQRVAETEWSETILEGPFIASFQIQLKTVREIYDLSASKSQGGGPLIGWEIRISDRA